LASRPHVQFATAKQELMTKIRSIDAITLTATNMAASISFYSALGFTLSFGGDDSEFTTMSIEPNGPHVNLILRPTDNAVDTTWGRVIFHVDDVDELHRTAVAAGLTPQNEPTDASWGERYFAIFDPTGHDISFAKPLNSEP